MSKGTILITPRGYANYGKEEKNRFIELGYDVDINETGKSYYMMNFEKSKSAVGIILELMI